jgi:hypothetical protein
MDTTQLDELIQSCSYPGSPNNHPLIDSAIVSSLDGTSREEFCDAFSRRIALEYAAGRMRFEVADAAMNRLGEYAFLGDETFIPPYSREVFEAFDAGEYFHSEDPPGTDPEEKHTRPWILEIVGRG